MKQRGYVHVWQQHSYARNKPRQVDADSIWIIARKLEGQLGALRQQMEEAVSKLEEQVSSGTAILNDSSNEALPLADSHASTCRQRDSAPATMATSRLLTRGVINRNITGLQHVAVGLRG
ncbi:hypothetical protein SYNPS1DRAFT_30294 [Syncephalis pseudoplumigaleata]|uniref:Uncharacterized protein n=1 Tax=Syncephalis pseudoplumigaleata TaxID=1712513 RepID=A0A4P9YVT3_9FUNG|nr:hypothetical protein SYNPS1DRAFT_30294 [Syncephalis pseudoplumigaleata]|eukprot:RKP23935.1 hypothetical protein SYNPS1DRAFT_30294 [Syncephalis pseudoplumigaleata]